MKILAIRGKNLASLEGEFNIDFNAEPLKSAGIFAITGSTGAGKSTILDAMCLALFDNAPRISKGENIQVNDVFDKTINQTDSRNILRKGTGEGRAEVDFTAVNGETYRAVWYVRRVKNKPDGALLNTETKLYNLHTGIEEQGTKTVLLKRITELVGLTFNQFIRAVLLAQGDFATFLKAKQSDKAELLEKLTGTDVYSKISATIFRKTKEATETLAALQQRIADTALLTDEEVAGLNSEKARIDNELEPIREILLNIEKKLDWIKQNKELSKEAEDAATELQKIQQSIETAKPRYASLEILDASLEIRDTCIGLQNKQEQLQKLKSNLASQETQLEEYGKRISGFDTELLKIKTELEQEERDLTGLKPAIARSKELDVMIQSAKEKLADAENELNRTNGQKLKSEANIRTVNDSLSNIKKQTDVINKWFEDKKPFRDIIPHVDLIVATLDDIRFAGEQISATSENLENSNAVLVSQKETLDHLEKEAERLNSLLPAEILNLRGKLADGEPCPVCGSLNHPVRTAINQSVKVDEKELEKQRNETANAINKTIQGIESLKESITQLETLIKGYRTQYNNAVDRIDRRLQTIDNWKKFVPDGSLKRRLLDFAVLWKKNEEELTKNTRQAELSAENLNAENLALADISAEYLRKETLHKDAVASLNALVSEHSTLLKGKTADEVESSYRNAIDKLSTRYERLKTEKAEIDSRKSEIAGIILQMRTDVDLVSLQIDDLKATVDNWIANSKHRITQDVLKDLVAKSHAWIAAEKKELAAMKDRETRLAATHRERIARLEKHGESIHKPHSEETAESLTRLSADTVDRERELKQQQTAVDVSLAKHRDNKTLVESLDAELQTKTKTCEEWKSLNSVLGSADGHRFKNIIQSYTMDILLEYANKHLQTLSKRYTLEKNGDLALQVIDNDMLGEVRSIHSLSGGESFLISLSLALGLSALSSNRMQIESLFIDEGFGSLDSDTLNIAIDALENLYTQGRKIGIISHVGEMRIPVQIQVIKSANGKSRIKTG
jgi:exonuclease SbcC